MYKVLGLGVLITFLYYVAAFVIADKAIETVTEESKSCGGVAKCSGKIFGSIVNDFKEGMKNTDNQ